MCRKLNFIIFLSILFIANIYCIEDLKYVYSSDGGLYLGSLKSKKVEKITTAIHDFNPSWAKSENKIVFIRIMEVPQSFDFRTLKTAVCMANKEGMDLKILTDASTFNINATWTRDGKNNIVFARYNADNKGFEIYINISGNPKEEKIISNPCYNENIQTCMKDGRLIIWSSNKNKFYALTPKPGSIGKYEEINLNFKIIGLIDKMSLSPDESKICFDMKEGYTFEFDGRTLYYADFDIKSLTISNIVPFTTPSDNGLDARWIKDEKTIMFSSTKSGIRQLYIYNLKTKKIGKVITDETIGKSESPAVESTPN